MIKLEGIVEQRLVGYMESANVTEDYNENNFEMMRMKAIDYGDKCSIYERPILDYADNEKMNIFIDRIMILDVNKMKVEDFIDE